MFANVRLSSILGLAAIANVCAAAALTAAPRCQGTTVRTKMIGVNNDVEIETMLCANGHDSFMTQPGNNTDVIQVGNSDNICREPCNTNCFHPSGGGPDPNHCKIIASALLRDADSSGDKVFVFPGSPPTFIMRYKSCEVFILNQVNDPLIYCYTSMAKTITSLAFNCQSTQNAHGGNCVADDQRWFVQVEARSDLLT